MSTTAPAVNTATVTPTAPQRKKVTTTLFRQKKERGEPITMLTAYDYPTALAEDQSRHRFHPGRRFARHGGAGLSEHAARHDGRDAPSCTRRRTRREVRPADRRHAIHVLSGFDRRAVRNAGRFLQEAGMEAVKLEGGRERAGCHPRHRRRGNSGDGTSWA